VRVVLVAFGDLFGVADQAGGSEDLLGLLDVDFKNLSGRYAGCDGSGEQRADGGSGAVLDAVARDAA
jgi:hypothetical protein